MYADSLALQSDLDGCQTWCNYEKLNLNCSKCKVMTFFRVGPHYTNKTQSVC